MVKQYRSNSWTLSPTCTNVSEYCFCPRAYLVHRLSMLKKHWTHCTATADKYRGTT